MNKSDIKNLSEKPTDDLLKILKSANNQKDLKSYISSNLDEELSLDEYLGNKLTEKGISKSQAIKNSNLDRTYGYEIFKGQVIGREKLIALCIGIGLNLTETQRALTIGKQKSYMQRMQGFYNYFFPSIIITQSWKQMNYCLKRILNL